MGVATVLLCYSASWYSLYQFAHAANSAGVSVDSPLFELVDVQRHLTHAVFAFTSVVVILMIFFGALFLSHRVAGPIYRLQRELEKLAEDSKLNEIKFRKDDYFPELAVTFNEVLAKREKKRSTSQDGFGLMEVVIASAVLGIVMLGVTEVVNYMGKSQRGFSSSLDFQQIRLVSLMTLANETTCTETFKNKKIYPPGADIMPAPDPENAMPDLTGIVINGQDMIPKSTAAFPSIELKVRDVKPGAVVSGNQKIYTAELQLKANKSATDNSMGSKSYTASFKTQFLVDETPIALGAAPTVVGCTSGTAGPGSGCTGAWQLVGPYVPPAHCPELPPCDTGLKIPDDACQVAVFAGSVVPAAPVPAASDYSMALTSTGCSVGAAGKIGRYFACVLLGEVTGSVGKALLIKNSADVTCGIQIETSTKKLFLYGGTSCTVGAFYR